MEFSTEKETAGAGADNQTFDVKGSGWGRRPNISTEEGRKFRRKKVGSRAVVPKFLTEEGRLGQASAWKF